MPGDARQHPVEHDQVGRALGDGHFGLVAAMHDIDGIAFRLEVVAKEERERLFILDDQDLGSVGSRRSSRAPAYPADRFSGTGVELVVSPFGR